MRTGFRLIWQLGSFDMMTRKCAVPLYCGMMTDTGGFTYNSTRPEIFFIISQLLTKASIKTKSTATFTTTTASGA